MQKIAVEKDEALTAHYPRRWPAKLIVKAGGATREWELLDSPGDPGARFDDEALADKAARVLDPLVAAGAATTWLSDVDEAVLDHRLLPALAAKLEQALAL